jgi:hypothetical protein
MPVRGHGFVLIDSTGRELINTNIPPGVTIPRVDWNRQKRVFAAKETFISPVIKGPVTRGPAAFVAVPVVQGGAVKRALGSFLYGEDFSGVFSAPGVPKDWIVSIVDGRGTHIGRSHLNENLPGFRGHCA